MTSQVDIIVVGAGLVGMASAVSLAQQGYRTALIDQKLITSQLNTDWDSRIYAITPENVRWLKALDVWTGVNQSRICPISAMCIAGDGAGELQLDASDVNAPNLGYIVESQQLMHALWQKLQSLDVIILPDSACQQMNISGTAVELTWQTTQLEMKTLVAQMVVAADGGHSWVRQQVGIPVNEKHYQHTAIVANFSCEKPHHNIARQWFTPQGVLAFLPMPDKLISIVWSAHSSEVSGWLALDEEDFSKKVAALSGQALGELKFMTARESFPLTRQSCARLTTGRVVLVGDAAHKIHPLIGQGVNLGFRDVIDLLNILTELPLKQRIDIASARNLRAYERARSVDVLTMTGLTNGLYELFESKYAAIKSIRNWGLSYVNQQNIIKKMLIKQAII